MSSVHEKRLKQWIEVLGEPDVEMSRVAADKLGEMRDTTATEPLIKAMTERTEIVAAAAAQALGRIGDSSAIPALINTLSNHQEILVRTAAAEALGIMRSREAIPALKKVITDYLERHKRNRYNMTRGFERGLFTTCIQSLKLIGTRDAVRFAENAESAGR